MYIDYIMCSVLYKKTKQKNSTVWYGMVQYGTVWYGTVRYGTVWYSTVRYGMVQYGMVRYGTVWYGTVRYGAVRVKKCSKNGPFCLRCTVSSFFLKNGEKWSSPFRSVPRYVLLYIFAESSHRRV